ncbi:MAG: TIGR03619 family F420-dependent LLM class oxidoreductase [Nostocoides sp.]
MTVFSVGMPNCKEGKSHPPGSVDASWMREIAVAADHLGFHALWPNELLQIQAERAADGSYDIPMEPVRYFDPLITIAYVAALTERIRFTTATIILPHHHPALLSRQVATLDHYTGGRLTLGVGLGGTAESFRRLRGDLGKVNRGAMMDEYLMALRSLWQQPPTTMEGRYVRMQDAQAFPKPRQDPVPIYIAGAGEASLTRVARLGQGWIDSHHLPHEIEQIASDLGNERPAECGRVQIARQFYVALGETRAAARDIYARVRGPLPTESATDEQQRYVIGSSDDIIATLGPYIGVVDEICLIFYGDSAKSVIEQCERFAGQVAPQLTGS